MIGRLNIRHTIQWIAGILIALFLLLGTNAWSHVQNMQDTLPEMKTKLSSDLSNTGNKVKKVTDDGYLQSLIIDSPLLNGVFNVSEATSSAKETLGSDDPVRDGVGEAVDTVGSWISNVWSKGEVFAQSIWVGYIETNPIYIETAAASDTFDELHQPRVSTVPVKSLYLDKDDYERMLDENTLEEMDDVLTDGESI